MRKEFEFFFSGKANFINFFQGRHFWWAISRRGLFCTLVEFAVVPRIAAIKAIGDKMACDAIDSAGEAAPDARWETGNETVVQSDFFHMPSPPLPPPPALARLSL